MFLTADELDIAEFALRDLVVEIQFLFAGEAMSEVDFSVRRGGFSFAVTVFLRDFWVAASWCIISVLFQESADFESEDETDSGTSP